MAKIHEISSEILSLSVIEKILQQDTEIILSKSALEHFLSEISGGIYYE